MNLLAMPVARLCLPDGEFLLYPGQQVRLGRSADNDIVLENPKISRHHARVAWDGRGFVLEDLGSSNGTYLNLIRLEGGAQPLHHGDQISLSRLGLVFEVLDLPPAGAENLPGAERLPRAGETPEILGLQPDAPPGRPEGPCLVVVGGLDLGREYPLWGETITIGRDSRDATWEIRLTDRLVSRPHARLESGEAGYTLVDLGSANGTSLNGRRVAGPVLLHDGDEIGVGATRLIFYS